MVGHFPGDLGHVNVTVSMLFAGISGSFSADAAGIGSLIIPQMKKDGYSTSFSVAITPYSSVMGVIIPPSILMVIWVGLMSVSIGGSFLAGVVPGILIAASQMVAVYVFAKIYNYPTSARSSIREFAMALLHAIPPLTTPLMIVGGIVDGFSPRLKHPSFLAGCSTAQFIWAISPRSCSNRENLLPCRHFCIGTASTFGWLLAYFKIPLAVVDFLGPYAVGPTSTGLIVTGSFLLIGMFIDAIPAIIILGAVLWPQAEHAHMHPIHLPLSG